MIEPAVPAGGCGFVGAVRADDVEVVAAGADDFEVLPLAAALALDRGTAVFGM